MKNTEAVLKAVEDLRTAMLEANETKLRELTAAELSYGHSNGNIEDQATFVHSIISGKDKFASIEISDQSVNVVRGIAIVRHRFKAQVSVNGEPLNANIGVMHIWQNEAGHWKLLARQAFK